MVGLASTVAETAVPLYAVDEVVADRVEVGWLIRARKVINEEDPYMVGHFPGATIYPGVFIIESLRQAVSEGLGMTCDIVSVRSARFLMPLVVGDVMVLDATVEPAQDGTLSVTANAVCEHGGIPVAKLGLLLRQHEVVDA
jgi:3-hydroxymyristoyl/3-hydroxydecanoyl-(acyl carrier protein) dehydratase